MSGALGIACHMSSPLQRQYDNCAKLSRQRKRSREIFAALVCDVTSRLRNESTVLHMIQVAPWRRGAPKAQDGCASKRHPFYAETSMPTLQSVTSYRHFERSEKSLSFAAWRSMIGNSKRETCYPLTFGHRPIYIAAKLAPQP